jgi:hypothetical protein
VVRGLDSAGSRPGGGAVAPARFVDVW